jgi:hypothetical protein
MKINTSKIFLLNTRDYTVGVYCLYNNQICSILTEKTIHSNRNLWKSSLASRLEVNPSSDFREVFFDRHPEYPREYYEFEELYLVPGQYHSRIYRPIFKYDSPAFFRTPHDAIQQLREEINQTVDYLPNDLNLSLSGITKLSSLVESFKSISRVVHPELDNLKVYGNDIRSLLILASTEVESQMRGILAENSSTFVTRPTTSEYVKLKEPLHLDIYKVKFTLFPWLGEFSPFSSWVEAKPTQSLAWYDAYNSVKHNNAGEFKNATLESALNAIAAVAILLTAQYGTNMQFWRELIGNFFEIECPKWNINEYYFPPIDDDEWFTEKLFSV